jgi:3-phosphoshikimate 1-carboxyvinyltransferase
LNVTIRPGAPLGGEFRPPGDKSLSHRAAILGALATGATRARGFSPAEDCASTLACLQELGVRLRREGDALLVEGVGEAGFREPSRPLPCGNSGTTMRLLLGALAGMDLFAVLSGDDSLNRRPMDRVLQPLGRMGARADGRTGRLLPPVAIRGGGLRGAEHELPVASAQVKSALLLAGLRARGETAVTEPAPSRDHTERMLGAMGAECRRDGLRVSVRPSTLRPLDIAIPGDPSSAAFLLGAALVSPGSEVRASGVGLNPTRAGFLRVLRRMGADVAVEAPREEGGEPVGDLHARHSALRATEIGGAEIPSLIDELPLLAVLATQAEGRTVIRDAGELRVKETDRIAALTTALRAMGAQVEERPDGWELTGPSPLRGAEVEPEGDHRIAMALSVAALAARDPSVILDAGCVAVSYPEYWRDLGRLGGGMEE